MSQNIMAIEPGDLIKRRIESKWHYGVYCGNGLVFDSYPPRGEGLTRFEDFKKDKDIEIEVKCPPDKKQTVFERIRAKLAKPKLYNLLTDNCEHVAREVFAGKKVSYQLSGIALGLIVLGCFVWLLYKN